MTEGWVNDTAWFGISFFGVTAVEGSTVLPVSVKKNMWVSILEKTALQQEARWLEKEQDTRKSSSLLLSRPAAL